MIFEKNAWIRQGKGLGYLKPIITRSIEHAVECREAIVELDKDKSEVLERTLPTAGKEVSLVPLILASCYEEKYLASVEVNVVRKSSEFQGKLDLIIYNHKKKEKSVGDLIEVKAAGRNVFGKTFTNNIKLRLNDALEQLDSIDMKEFESVGEFGRVALVMAKVIVPTNKLPLDDEDLPKAMREHFQNLKLSDDCDGIAYSLFKPHIINVKKGSRPKYTGGLLIAVKRL